jgi:hypothetical protein
MSSHSHSRLIPAKTVGNRNAHQFHLPSISMGTEASLPCPDVFQVG